jgi:hypothetical protein
LIAAKNSHKAGDTVVLTVTERRELYTSATRLKHRALPQQTPPKENGSEQPDKATANTAARRKIACKIYLLRRYILQREQIDLSAINNGAYILSLFVPRK